MGASLVVLVWLVWQPLAVMAVQRAELHDDLYYDSLLPFWTAVSVYRLRYHELAGDVHDCCAAAGAAAFVAASRPRDSLGRDIAVEFDSTRGLLLLRTAGYPLPDWPAGLRLEPPGVHAVVFVGGKFLNVWEHREALGLDYGHLRADRLDLTCSSEADWRDSFRIWMSADPPAPPRRHHTCLTTSEIAELGRFDEWEPDWSRLPASWQSEQIGLTRRR